uniref:Serine/threonine protein kinase n=1 Tax=Strongyloides venezuelensis TaxID=75913 RepID=A0A0K0G0E2_STRVS
MVYVPDLSKAKITDKLNDIKNYFKGETKDGKSVADGSESPVEKEKENVVKKNAFSKMKDKFASKRAVKTDTTFENETPSKKKILFKSKNKLASKRVVKLDLNCENEKKDNLKIKKAVDKKVIDDMGPSNKKETTGNEKNEINQYNESSGTDTGSTTDQKAEKKTVEFGNLAMQKFNNFKDNMLAPNMEVISDKWSSSVKYVRKNIKNIEVRRIDFGSLKNRLSTLTSESRRERLLKLEEEESGSSFNFLSQKQNKVAKTQSKGLTAKVVDDKGKETAAKEDDSKKVKKGKMDKMNPYSYMANLSVADIKGLIPEKVYNRLYMNNKFSTGCFTDKNGRPHWAKKSNYKSVDSTDESETDSGDVCATVTDSLIAFCEGKFEIPVPLTRSCTLGPDGELQELTKNDPLYTIQNVVNNTVRTFSKMEEYKKSTKSTDCTVEQDKARSSQMPPLKFAKEVKVIIYNRVNPCELVEPIKFVPVDIGPTKFIDSKIINK